MLTNASKFTLFSELDQSFALLLRIANSDSEWSSAAQERLAIIENEVDGIGVFDLIDRVSVECSLWVDNRETQCHTFRVDWQEFTINQYSHHWFPDGTCGKFLSAYIDEKRRLCVRFEPVEVP